MHIQFYGDICDSRARDRAFAGGGHDVVHSQLSMPVIELLKQGHFRSRDVNILTCRGIKSWFYSGPRLIRMCFFSAGSFDNSSADSLHCGNRKCFQAVSEFNGVSKQIIVNSILFYCEFF